MEKICGNGIFFVLLQSQELYFYFISKHTKSRIMKIGIVCFLTTLLLAACGTEKDGKGISEETVQSLLAEVKTADKELLERGVRQTAALWTE